MIGDAGNESGLRIDVVELGSAMCVDCCGALAQWRRSSYLPSL